MIAKRRIGHSAEKIGVFVNNTDLVEIPAENVELLQKFIPTKDEVITINMHSFFYHEQDTTQNNVNCVSKDEMPSKSILADNDRHYALQYLTVIFFAKISRVCFELCTLIYCRLCIDVILLRPSHGNI